MSVSFVIMMNSVFKTGHQDDNWYRYRPVLPQTIPSLETTIILHSSKLGSLGILFCLCYHGHQDANWYRNRPVLPQTTAQPENCTSDSADLVLLVPLLWRGSLRKWVYTGRVTAHPLLPQANTPTASREEHSVSPWNWLSQLPVIITPLSPMQVISKSLFLAEWPESFTGYCSNTGVEWILK